MRYMFSKLFTYIYFFKLLNSGISLKYSGICFIIYTLRIFFFFSKVHKKKNSSQTDYNVITYCNTESFENNEFLTYSKSSIWWNNLQQNLAQ